MIVIIARIRTGARDDNDDGNDDKNDVTMFICITSPVQQAVQGREREDVTRIRLYP